MITWRASGVSLSAFVFGLSQIIACGSNRDGFDTATASPDASFGDEAGTFGGDRDHDAGGLPEGETRDPVDCEEAERSKSYVGCDYWPTVTPNGVWSIFDFAVVVANAGAKDAIVTISGPGAVNKQTTVPAGQLRTIYLPWVTLLKGPDMNECGASTALTSSVIVSEGAYHLVSTMPVIVYQFSALQYRGVGGESASGGPKDWSTCPGNNPPAVNTCPWGAPVPPCFSYSNDASLLLPSTALTGNYRVSGYKGLVKPDATPSLSVTATQPNTKVVVNLSSTATVLASDGGPPVAATLGGALTLTLPNAGDVAELVTPAGEDFSGSLVQADKPIQVMASIHCMEIGNFFGRPCDHIEETVLPAETLGKHYIITQPTGPKGGGVQHAVRFYGNKDVTTLTYSPRKPKGCPDTLNAGEVVECNQVNETFEVQGDNEFAVAAFLLSAVTSIDKRGDPSQTTFTAVEQFRTTYVFLAPSDYPALYADITATEDASIQLDGQPIAARWEKLGTGPYGVHRVDLTKSGTGGAHRLVAKKPVGVQVIGYGDYTSFQYPAGMNLKLIAPPPVVK